MPHACNFYNTKVKVKVLTELVNANALKMSCQITLRNLLMHFNDFHFSYLIENAVQAAEWEFVQDEIYGK